MLILVGFQLDSSIWMLDVSPIPGVVFGYSPRGRSVGDIPVCTLVADNRKLSWLCDFP